MDKEWNGFRSGIWQNKIDVRNFIQRNYNEYEGDESFLTPPTEKTEKLHDKILELMAEERKKGILDAETTIPSSITSHGAGYIDKDLEIIYGLQTDKPLKRGIYPRGGLKMVISALESYGYSIDPVTQMIFSFYRKTHNDAVFDAYTDEMKMARKAGILTGLPDAYGRGRIIGDYRRVALYGMDRLIEDKKYQKDLFDIQVMDEESIRMREEIQTQINSLTELKEMAAFYGFDIGKPASNAFEAFQWTYFAFLAAVKEQDGAAMSFGRISTFLDIYIQRDLRHDIIDESYAQELVDQLILKLRIVRFLRTPEYNDLFSGDPTWITESLGGMGVDGRSLVTKTTFRFLHSLKNLGPSPEPNLTVLWSSRLPRDFKIYCSKLSIETSSIQYESDDLMREYFGDDYAIACCVSAMKIGKQMQFFGARANIAKALLYAINGGKDEMTNLQVAPMFESVKSEYLDFNDVMVKYDYILEWLAGLYIRTLNTIHAMHDKYAYESLQMGLHDKDILRTMATGIAGLSVAADSLSAIKYAKVKTVRNKDGMVTDYVVEGDFPKYGNNDDRVDLIAYDLVERFMNKLRKQKTYRNSVPTMSVLTITSNVVYGKKTGSTPDGRKAGEPFAPGANPMHGRDVLGAAASLQSVAKLPYEHSLDGISNTFTIVPDGLGSETEEKVNNLASLLDAYFKYGGHHLNINVLNRKTLLDAMIHPEEYPQLTIRVSGYAVNFIKLTKEQQLEVINRTFHKGY